MTDQIPLALSDRRPARRALEMALGVPWAITPEGLETILLVAARMNESPELVAQQLGRPLDNTRAVNVRDGVATIDVHGMTFRYANLLTDVSGATSYQILAAEIERARTDPNVRSILLDFDSPGGEVNGCSELAAFIYRGSARFGGKPVTAYVSGMCASAAYWLASATDEIIAADTAQVGGLGCMATFVDESRADEQAGVRVIEIISSQTPNKNESPATAAGMAMMKRRVDALAAVFLDAVAVYRGVSAKAVADNYGQGDVLVGTAAVKAGLADRLGTFAGVHAKLAPNGTRGLRLAAGTSLRLPIAADGPLGRIAAGTGLHDLNEITAAYARLATIPLSPPEPAAAAPDLSAPEKAAHEEDRTMEPTKAAAPQGAPDPLTAERERMGIITSLAAEHNIPMARVNAWLAEGATAEVVRGEILAGYRGKLALVPTSSAEQLDAAARITGPQIDREAVRPFASLGEQLQAIVRAGSPGGSTDKRLMHIMAAVSGGSTGVGGDGGFLVQKDFSAELFKEAFATGQLSSRCSQTEIGPNADGLEVVYVDESSRATGSRWGGVQIYRTGEGDAATAKKPKIGKWECRLEDLMGVAYLTERLMQDGSAMAQVFQEAFAEEFGFVLDDEILRGTGVGQCLGLLSTGACTVSTAKETGQLSATIVAENIANMWARVLPRAKAGGFWFMNTECNPQLDQLQVGTGTSGQLVFMPAGGLSESPFGRLKGRPVIEIEQASALGTVGDLFFADLSYYKLITKGGLQADESIHVRFLNNERTLRWVTRVNGAPKLKSAITPYKGSNTLSPFVTLATRA
jgi:HK97 family phage major capsid protein